MNIKNMHYNPFKHLSDRASAGDSDYDKFYAEDFAETFNCIDRASKNLEKCSYHKIKSKFLAEFSNEDVCDFKTLFYNIDGNRTNFDIFSTELQTQDVNYSIIALAETNISEDKGDLYKLNDYLHSLL